MDVGFDFLDGVAGVAEAVERVEAYVAIAVARAVAAESFEEATVRWRGAGVSELE